MIKVPELGKRRKIVQWFANFFFCKMSQTLWIILIVKISREERYSRFNRISYQITYNYIAKIIKKKSIRLRLRKAQDSVSVLRWKIQLIQPKRRLPLGLVVPIREFQLWQAEPLSWHPPSTPRTIPSHDSPVAIRPLHNREECPALPSSC